jgi:hypothetical protein
VETAMKLKDVIVKAIEDWGAGQMLVRYDTEINTTYGILCDITAGKYLNDSSEYVIKEDCICSVDDRDIIKSKVWKKLDHVNSNRRKNHETT